MDYIERAIADGHVRLTGDGKQQKIIYVAASHTERFSDPEEQVRAEFWAELIYRYEYKPELIGFETLVPRRTPQDRADLVVYEDRARKAPYIVIECKRADITDAEFIQAIEQACGNRGNLGAAFAGAVAGGTRRFLDFTSAKPMERKHNIISDLPIRYGKPPEWRYFKGLSGKELAAVPREELRAAIRKCHQSLWEGGRRSQIVAFGEFCKIVFVKIRDEIDTKRAHPYAFQRRTDEADEDLATRILDLYRKEQKRDPTVFVGKIDVDAGVLAQVIEHLQSISLNRTDLDTKGVAFEEFMGGFFKGDFGAFFTPRELVAFCVQMLAPGRNDLVLDPACGSGGFLLYALDHVRQTANREYPDHETDPTQIKEHFLYWHDFAQHNLFGIEINDELSRVAKMNMIIHDDGHTNVIQYDALDFTDKIKGRHQDIKPGTFDLVLTNPPFGSVVKQAEKGNDYLDQYELRRYLAKRPGDSPSDDDQAEGDAKRGAKAVKQRTSVKTEILFLERVHTYLKPSTGKAAVIVPDGVLTNSSLQGVRDWLLDHFQILAAVSLPQFAFAHYDAGVKASILFLRRLGDGETVADRTPIFMALAENIGYDATGRKTFVVTVENETPGRERIEIQRSDLFDYRVSYEWNTTNPKKPGWSERHREVLPDTGLVGQFRAFQKDPRPFFV